MNSFDDNLKLLDLENVLKCSICNQILRNPYFCSNCLSNCCYECFKQLMICPLCNNEKIKKNEFLGNLIEDLKKNSFQNDNEKNNEKKDEYKNIELNYSINIQNINKLIKSSTMKKNYLIKKCEN